MFFQISYNKPAHCVFIIFENVKKQKKIFDYFNLLTNFDKMIYEYIIMKTQILTFMVIEVNIRSLIY